MNMALLTPTLGEKLQIYFFQIPPSLQGKSPKQIPGLEVHGDLSPDKW